MHCTPNVHPSLIKKYKRAYSRAHLFLWQLHHREISVRRFSTVIVASHHGITRYSVLSAHSMTLVPLRHSLLVLPALPPVPLTIFRILELSPSLSLARTCLIWTDCTTTAIKHRDLARLRHFPNPDRTKRCTLYIAAAKRRILSAVSCFRCVEACNTPRNRCWCVCVCVCIATRAPLGIATRDNFEISNNYW